MDEVELPLIALDEVQLPLIALHSDSVDRTTSDSPVGKVQLLLIALWMNPTQDFLPGQVSVQLPPVVYIHAVNREM